MLICQQPLFVSHLRKIYALAGKSLFNDANAWVALTDIFADVLRDPSLRTTYLTIDALDKCVTDLSKLLNFAPKLSSTVAVKALSIQGSRRLAGLSFAPRHQSLLASGGLFRP
jgi:hypothetical protein